MISEALRKSYQYCPISIFSSNLVLVAHGVNLKYNLLRHQHIMSVVYFNQQTGAPQAFRWSKSIFLTLKQLFTSLTEQNKEKRKESRQKHAIKEGSTSKKVFLFNAG